MYEETEARSGDRLHMLKYAFNEATRNLGPGCVLEFGVRDGMSFHWMSRMIVTLDLPVSLYGFDSFEGLPEETPGVWNHPKHSPGAYAARRPRIVDDSRLRLMEGWFEDTLTEELAQRLERPVLLVEIDCDLHSSTKTVLDWIGPLLTRGSLLYFDDWHEDGRAPWGEKLAFMEWDRRLQGELLFETVAEADHGRRLMRTL